MALIKMSKGEEAHLPQSKTEGQLYFTTDTGKIFLDTSSSDRMQIGVGADSPAFTGTPTAPTQSASDNSTKIATTEYVTTAVANKTFPIDDALSSTSTNPVQNKVINSSITTINTNLGNKVDKVTGKGLSTNDFTDALKTKLDGIATGATKVTVDTALSSSSTNPVQNKVINTALGLKAPLASPALSGTPTAPTAATTTNNTQIATTAFVKTAITNAAYSLPLAANGTRGGMQIGFTTNAASRNYAVALSSEKAYVAIPAAAKGAYGVVSLPNENTTTKYYRQDGTWVVPPNTTYTFDGTYDASSNKAATVSTVTGKLGRSDAVTAANINYGTAMARAIYAGTTDMVVGTSTLTNGTIYLYYEA